MRPQPLGRRRLRACSQEFVNFWRPTLCAERRIAHVYGGAAETRIQPDGRRALRRSLRLATDLVGSEEPVIIHDLCLTGLLIETSEELSTGELLLVEIPERGPTPATVVWNSGRFFGCQFESTIPAASVSAALLRNPFGEPRPFSEVDEGARPAVAPEASDAGSPAKYSPRTRLLVILALAVAAWAMVALLASLLI